MNVRFFYDDAILELVGFTDFAGGYGTMEPSPPWVNTSEPAGQAMFNFQGAAEFINGAIQLVNENAPPLILDTTTWTKVFSICFLVEDEVPEEGTFYPPVVWDLEQDPANGGFFCRRRGSTHYSSGCRS